MYPSGGTSGQAFLPAGPSTGSQQWTSEAVGLEGIVVDSPSNDPQESTVPVAIPKPRPLNLADKYEIVGGVPAFVWKPSSDYTSNYRVYAISSDGTRIAISAGWQKICVHDMMDNFSLVAEWEDTSYEYITDLTFHDNQNNELIVVFRDSTVAMMSFARKSKDRVEQSNVSQQHIGALEIMQEICILDKFEDIGNSRVYVHNHGVESWAYAWDITIRNIFTMCSIKEGRFRRLQVKSDFDITSTFTYFSIPQKAIMLVTMRGDSTPLDTRIWIDLDFDSEINEESPIELSGRQGFGFSDCGSYFLAWKYSQHSENAIEAYDVRLLKTSTNPIAKRIIGLDVLRARAHFIEGDRATLEVLGHARPEKSLNASILVTSSNKVELTFWDVSRNEMFKKFNLTMQKAISL